MAENNPGVINALKESQKEGARVIKDELKDQFKPFTDQLTAPLQAMKAGIEALPGVGVTKKLFSAVSTPLKNAFAMDSKSNIEDQKKENEERREGEANKTLMEDIRDGILGIQDGLVKGLAGLKDKGLGALGILAGLVAAPFATLVAFFGQLKKEVAVLTRGFKALKDGKVFGFFARIADGLIDFFKMLNPFGRGAPGAQTPFGRVLKMVSDGYKKVLGPVFKIFDSVSDFGNSIKGSAGFKRLGFFGKRVTSIMKTFSEFVTGILTKFGSFARGAKGVISALPGFKPVIDFAKTIGKTLGRIFLPVTIIMTLFDTVKGAIAGYEDDGWLGALEGGLTGLINSIIGLPLDLLKSAFAWMLGLFGFDEASEAVKSFSFQTLISDGIGAVFDFGKKAFAWFGTLFTDPVTALKELWTGLVGEGGFLDLITTPFNLAVNWLLGLFGWSDPETEFNLLSSVTSAFSSAVAWVKDLFSWPEDGDVGTAVSKFIDIVLAPYNLAVNWLMGLFGWSSPDGEPFSIGKLVTDAVSAIFEWFTGLLDFDFGEIVRSIPGAGKVLDLLGFGEKTQDEQIAEKVAEIQKLQEDVAKDSWYETESGRQQDIKDLAKAMEELELLKTQGGGGNVTNNFNNIDNRTSSQNVSIQNQQLQDANSVANS